MSSSEDTIEMRVVMQGVVQGVGFRVTARRYAVPLGLVGTVRNLPDGSVEMHLLGPRDKILELLRKLKEHFPQEYIQDIRSEEIPSKRTYVDFRIL